MANRQTLLTIAWMLLFLTNAAAKDFTPYKWEENRTITPLSEEETEYGLYYIQRVEDYQYVYENGDGNLVCYATEHHIIRVSNDDAVNTSNTIYIPMRNAMELTDLRARVITSSGKTINFDENNIKELENEDAGYKIFAVEGAEIGSEIEYYFTRKIYASSFNSRKIQFSHPVKSLKFTVTCPNNLEYDFKVYNSQAAFDKVDDSDDFNRYTLNLENIPALHEEDFSAYESSKARVEYKLAYNSYAGNRRLNTWGVAGQRIYNQVYSLTSEEEKALGKFIKQLDLDGDPLDAFRRTEHYIKTNYFYEENAGDAGDNIAAILQNKYASSKGFTKLYAAILNHLGLEHEIVLASDKYNRFFDPDFDSWNFLEDYLIYINSADMFLTPREIAFRLGTIENEYIGTYALFIRKEKVQDFMHPVAHIAKIPIPPHTVNYDNLDLHVKFDGNLEMNNVKVIRTFSGYSNQYYRMAMLLLPEERKKDILEDIVKYLSANAEILSQEVMDTDYGYKNWFTPFRVKSEFETDQFIEKAGNIILFKAGDLIGPQSELYQEEERETRIVNSYNRGYHRLIHIEIPDGYSVKNADDLIIDEVINNENGVAIFKFTSSYTLKGQQLDIEIIEYYDQLYYPAEKFEEFRRVINAAADWNKIVLVLEE